MKLLLLSFTLILSGFGAGIEILQKRAVLILPEEIEFRSGAEISLNAEIELRWDESESLHLHLWLNPRTRKVDRVCGTLAVFDENGRELGKVMHVTIPLTPDGQTIMTTGEVKRFGLYELYSTVIFPRPGDYYAIAEFSYATAGKKSVLFRTNKRWFKITEGPPKKSSL